MLGRKAVPTSVEVRLKRYAVVIHLVQVRQRKNLKSTAVRQNRAIPIHKLVESTQALHAFVAWAQVEVVGVT